MPKALPFLHLEFRVHQASQAASSSLSSPPVGLSDPRAQACVCHFGLWTHRASRAISGILFGLVAPQARSDSLCHLPHSMSQTGPRPSTLLQFGFLLVRNPHAADVNSQHKLIYWINIYWAPVCVSVLCDTMWAKQIQFLSSESLQSRGEGYWTSNIHVWWTPISNTALHPYSYFERKMFLFPFPFFQFP